MNTFKYYIPVSGNYYILKDIMNGKIIQNSTEYWILLTYQGIWDSACLWYALNCLF